MKNILKLAAAAVLLGSTFVPAQSAQNATDVYVVMFRADWCPPCKVVEPRLSTALENMRDPSIEYVNIDISDSVRIEASAHRAFDRQIVKQYNSWYGATGFAAVIDADTKTTLGCVNIQYSTQDMVTHIRNLKSYAVANAAITNLTCPEPNNPL